MSFRATKKSKDESYLDIDLKELFGGKVPDNSSFRQAVGQEILDTIKNRTLSGKFLAPAKGSYSEEYVESLEFQAAGKSENDVNLKQTGDMLGFMDVVKETGSNIRIGWSDSEDQAKATNHNFGITVPKREFMGLTGKEIDRIRSKFKDELEIVQSDEPGKTSVDKLSSFVRGEFGLGGDQSSESVFASLLSGLREAGDGEG